MEPNPYETPMNEKGYEPPWATKPWVSWAKTCGIAILVLLTTPVVLVLLLWLWMFVDMVVLRLLFGHA
jgi:hypothetical protein